ncbi:uncharacterized protein F4807DRAFT_459502 [Annulohypoxylon truncatum]|uniref:uncharacterized protein n=1 Tax=Annulohypoxylon truncatum TaxID=327061 RepID=UPI002008AC50|nr:uncharacterized protein F4807DRAFT_459502 [Annulohypoxylon truncatum]KAI1210662.1 hypothetical protein F4807DRAFT_459502 [Annulohypoxylon truncatum]
MGWMWSSPPPQGPNSNPNSSLEQSKPSPSTKQTESQYGDPEIAKFMAQLQEEFGSNSKPAEAAKPPPPQPPPSSSNSAPSPQSTSTSTSSSSSSSSSSWTRSLWGSSNKSEPSPSPSTTLSQPNRQTWTPSRLDPLSESLLPTEMSCRQAFDTAFHCNSLGGQWTAVYREGNVRSCSEHWDDFWFCMRTRTLPTQQKEDAVRAHYRRKEYLKYFAPDRPSSADVWEPRDEKLEPGAAFAEPLEMPDVSDEEWRRQEIERRRRVREMLAKDEA